MLYQRQKREENWQLRLADDITTFAGSMNFDWVHAGTFTVWIASGLFGADRYPFQFLTFVVSLEAIFLSTFVMIGQNRQSTFQQAKADHDFHAAETEIQVNTGLTRAIHRMTTDIHAVLAQLQESDGGARDKGWDRSSGGSPEL